MFRRDTFALIAIALIGIGFTIYLAIGSTPFFPRSLYIQQGECPSNTYSPAERGLVMDEFYADWYSSGLLAFHEEALFPDKRQNSQSVRFTLLRSFHAPVMVRTVETSDGQIRLIGKWLAGPDGCETTSLSCSVDRVLTQAERERFKAAQGQLHKASYACDGGMDGSRWLLEASGRGDYKIWSEWSPKSGDLRDLALVMLDLTGWRLAEVY